MKNDKYYQPVAQWSGRLVLPSENERRQDGGVFFEIHNTPAEQHNLQGKTAWLVLRGNPAAQDWIEQETCDISFTPETYLSKKENKIHPDRLNGWNNVSPLETLAGGRLEDDVCVLLKSAQVISAHEPTLSTNTEPVQICGVFKALVQFTSDVDETKNQINIIHFNPQSGQFNGARESVGITAPWFREDIQKNHATLKNIHQSPLNKNGWYIYGHFDDHKEFIVEAVEPKDLLHLKIDHFCHGIENINEFIDHGNWKTCRKQHYQTTFLDASFSDESVELANTPIHEKTQIEAIFKEGTTCLLIHLFGWIKTDNPGAIEKMGIVMGHFALGIATVVKDPFTHALKWDIEYKQIYAHTVEGIISGSQKWHNYMGSLKKGWMYLAPVSDILIYHPGLCHEYQFDDFKFNPFYYIENNLHRVMARIRSGGGTGLASVNMATSCVQDAALGLFAAIQEMKEIVSTDKRISSWINKNPSSEQHKRLQALTQVLKEVDEYLRPYKLLPARWFLHEKKIKLKLPFPNLTQFADALLTNKTVLPRIAHDGIAKLMAQNNAFLWVMRFDQIGGEFAGHDPVWPSTFKIKHPIF